MSGAAVRHSGLQREVLSLYRTALRAARAKQRPDPFVAVARESFRSGAAVQRSDFQRIEHLLRLGRKRIATLSSEHVTKT